MDSKVIYTEEIDDLEVAVEELLSQTDGFSFRKNTMAILYMEEETDYLELYGRLSETWDFPIIGCTALSLFTGEAGFREEGIAIMLLTADDCRFAVGITESLNADNYKEQIENVYRPISDALNHEEKLIISYGVLVTDAGSVAGDNLVSALDAVSGKVPILGGLASDSFNFTKSRVFYNDKVVQNGQVIALVSGEIHPRFISINSIENRANFSYEITKSDCNQIFRLGDETFLDVLKKEQLAVDKTDVIPDYLLSPFVVSVRQPDGEQVDVARNLSILNHEDGSGTFLGAMPEGSFLSVGIINREDVQHSVEKAFDIIMDLIQKSDSEYRTIICMTCAARFLALASDVKAETNVCCSKLPEGFSLLGMYAYGEFCPVIGKKSGEGYNMFHNFTFTILAL